MLNERIYLAVPNEECACQVLASAGRPQDAWEEAARRVTRLPPAAYAEVPARIRSLMEADRCRVSQDPSISKPHNVISGRFASTRQRDWVAFCSANGITTVRIYWGGPARCPALRYSKRDVGMLQDYQFYMHLSTDSPSAVRAAAREFGTKIPPISHDVIDIGSEKASVAYLLRSWQVDLDRYRELELRRCHVLPSSESQSLGA